MSADSKYHPAEEPTRDEASLCGEDELTPGERFRRFATRVLAVPKSEIDREAKSVKDGKPLHNPFAPVLPTDVN